ncbi:uncharacterized protein Hap1MRO34_003470 isoform 1-T1 [Clarias gariepinus]|uniref:uncharacterized protein LOC128518473 isoform X1 n=1 Tax=Clarias gariepinus TaxID=13013 RepID=UPI00234DA85B|nr:uncharacterized protein LOC128518473 isoform X1 [Clarias gariepinus]
MSFVRSVVAESSWFCSNTCFHSGHQQISNPIIPYVGPIITGGLKPGTALYVQGTVPDNANQFSINFQTGQNKYDDIAFHFNPWIGQFIYLNSFQNGNWEVKECVPDESFTSGAAFNMFIVIKADGYEVYVNDLRCYMFQHRIPLEKVTTLGICGDVNIDFFGLCENWRRPCVTEQAITSTVSSFANMLPTPAGVLHRVIQPVLPHVGEIKERLKPEMALFFQGALPAHPKEFEINLQTGQSDNEDIAFHFNPCIGRHVSLNSFRNGQWETEECVSDELFTKGAAFYMFVVITSVGYEVYVNGLQLCMFNHRVPLENVSAVSIYGDVAIPIYGFIDNWSKSFNFKDLLRITGMGSPFSSVFPILAEVLHPVICPALPYVGTIRGGIRPDMAVFFQGTLPAHAKKFVINFQTGQSDTDDIAFHFNPRIGQHVYLNSFRNGQWETEETAPDKPFTKGAAFNMLVIINSTDYEVHVNGLQLCTFKHRMALENISGLAICGDISIFFYGFIDNWSKMDRSNVTRCTSSFLKQLSVLSEVSHPVIQPALPYIGSIKNEIRPDMALLFHGAVSDHGKSFEINLLTGDSDSDDVAFHISPQTGKSVTLNSFINGSWETEEYASSNPFTKGAPFHLFLVIQSEGYQVCVNSVQLCTFKHRIPLEKVSALSIRGDITINYFGFVESWSSSSVARKINETAAQSSISGLTHIPSEISHPVINPELPYVGAFQEGLRTDTAVFLQGVLPADANKFTINLLTGESEGDDIAFHISPRIGDIVALNSFRNGSWETEEQVPVTAFTKEAALSMFIVINSEGYEVYVNDSRLCTFKHRIPLVNVSALGIFGDVIINYFGLVENWSDSSMVVKTDETKDMLVTDVPSEISHPISSPELLHVDAILEGEKTDETVTVQMALHADTNTTVNFKTIHNQSENCSESSLVTKMNEIQDIVDLTDVPLEISHPDSSTKLLQVDAITEGSKTDETVTVQMALHADTNSAVNFKTIHIESEICSESSMVTHINEVQDMSLTVGSLIDVPPEISHPVSSPKLPYAGEIPGGLRTDMAVVFQGTLPADAKEFTINLLTGDSEGDDIAFHISPRIGDIVALNSFRNGSWETEEQVSVTAFTKEAALSMFIVINLEGYEVYVNNSRLCTFKHRIPLMNVSALGVFGDVIINYFGLVENWSDSSMVVKIDETQDMLVTDVPSEISHRISSPELLHVDAILEGPKTNETIPVQMALHADTNTAVNFKTIHIESEVCSESSMVTNINEVQDMSLTVGSLIDVPLEISHPVNSPELPYVGEIPGGLKTDMAVVFHAVLPADAKEFTINLLTGESEGDDIAFHISPRIGNIVALNSFRNGSWETEEQVPVTAFTKEAALSMFIVINSEGYEVYVNDSRLCTFKHRIPLVNVSALGIFGDVIINYFGLVENWSDSSMVVKTDETKDMLVTDVPSEISHPISSPELLHVDAILEEEKTDETVTVQMALHADTNSAVNFKTIHTESEELFQVDAIVEGPKTDETVNVQMALHADTNTAVNFKTIHIESEICSEFSLVMKMNEIQDIVDLTDVPSEIPHPDSSPELLHIDAIVEGPKTDETVTVQMALHADSNKALNFKTVHTESEICSESFMVTNINEVQDMSLTVGSLIDVPLEISHSVSSPELPYVGEIPGGLKTDMAVVFHGALPADAKEFTINLLTGESEGDDIAFHISPRIGDIVALNSFRNGSWETEEQVSVTAFTKEAALSMFIVINSEGYEVYVNDSRLCTFKHRIPLVNVSALGIFGDVIINYFGLVENWSRSSLALENNEIKEMTSTSLTLVTSEELVLPFVGSIPGGIRADMAVLFYGTIFADSNEFEINFQTPQSSDDIAFSINPQIVRFLVLSSLRKGSWDSKDFASDKEAAFNMVIVIKLEGYEVYVNGLQYCTFKHHAPLETITSLGIRGDVFINFIGFIANWSNSSTVMENIKITGMERSCWRPLAVPSELSHPVSNPVLPYVGAIPGKTSPDMAVLFQGALPADANDFTINFKAGESDGDDIAFHIRPQLGHHVALNSFRNGSWESEESVSVKPFTRGASFNMFVVIKSDCFEIYVNGLELCTFKHRVPIENISTLAICGDVSINFIGFIETWSTFSFIIENNELTGMRSSSQRCSSHQMIIPSSEDF